MEANAKIDKLKRSLRNKNYLILGKSEKIKYRELKVKIVAEKCY